MLFEKCNFTMLGEGGRHTGQWGWGLVRWLLCCGFAASPFAFLQNQSCRYLPFKQLTQLLLCLGVNSEHASASRLTTPLGQFALGQGLVDGGLIAVLAPGAQREVAHCLGKRQINLKMPP